MQMVGHEQKKMRVPIRSLMSEACGCKKTLGDFRFAELILSFGQTADGDKENGARLCPGWQVMRQLFSRRQ
jgi:hypothetical protein